MRHTLARLTLTLTLATACAPPTDDASTDDTGGDDVVTAEGDPNALSLGGHVLLPWPADQYTVPDAATATGLALAPGEGLLPDGFTPRMLQGDGFSRVTPAVGWLPGSVDPDTLPDPDVWDATTKDGASVVIVAVDGGRADRWPALVEIDATADDPNEATFIVRPHRPYPPGSTVVVLVTTDVTDAGGTAHPAHEAFGRILDGMPQGRAEEAWASSVPTWQAALTAAGRTADEVAQGWSFSVRTEGDVVDVTLAMQDIAAKAPTSVYTLDEVQYEADRALVYGTLQVPWFLGDDNTVVLDDAGMPVVVEQRSVPFLVTIPDTVTSPRPVVLFGHGFFSAIEEPTWSNLFEGLARWEMAAVTTQFFGFAEKDLGTAAAAIGGEDLEGLVGIIDLQRQSQANFTVLHRFIDDVLSNVVTVDWGETVIQPLAAEKTAYLGISNGGTQGLVMMSTSPVLDRGALVVPGGGWSHMLQRASQWSTLGAVFADRFVDDAELQLGSALTQQTFDPCDSLNYVEHLLDDRYEGRKADPEVLVVEALHDAQVANLVTRWAVGASGVPQMTPAVEDVWGVPTVDASGTGSIGGTGYEIYDLGVEPNPPGNVAATENGVHDQVRRLDAYREQMGRFLEFGEVVRTCDGVCDPE